jgi:hypothetical protein
MDEGHGKGPDAKKDWLTDSPTISCEVTDSEGHGLNIQEEVCTIRCQI